MLNGTTLGESPAAHRAIEYGRWVAVAGLGLAAVCLFLLAFTRPAPVIDCLAGKACIGSSPLFTIEKSDLENRDEEYLRYVVRRGALFYGFISLVLMGGLLLFPTVRATLAFPWSTAFAGFLFASVCLMYALLHYAFSAPWYDLEKLQANPVSVPVFGKRFLFIEVAKAFRSLRPGLTYVQSYFLSQFIAAGFATVCLGLLFWKRSGARGVLPGYLLFLAWIWPTFAYRTFYDFAIAGFYSLAVFAALAGLPVLYVLAIAIGSLNHENILLLVPVGWLLWQPRMDWRRATLWSAAAFAGWVAARLLQSALYPVPSAQYLKVIRNFRFIADRDSGAAIGLFWVAVCIAVTVACLPYASSFTRKAATLLPLLLLTTFLFGQFNEPRVFIAFLPVLCLLQLEALNLATSSAS